MPREYRHIQQYEKAIIELWEQGKTLREISEKFGFSKEQVQEFKTRYSIVAYKTGTEQNINLVLSTIREAKKKEKVTAELQLHSDQGFQYTSHWYFKLTQEYNITHSMSRRGISMRTEN